MMKYAILAILLLTNNAFAAKQMKIELENKNNNLRLYLINDGGEVLLNKRFSDGPSYISNDVKIEIEDIKGKEFPFAAMVQESEVTEQDIILFWPRDIVGREYVTDVLIKCYSLVPGTYKARAIYKNVHWIDKGVYSGQLISEWVTFKVTEEDMEKALGENWSKIMQNAYEIKRKTEEGIKKWKEEHK
jgi:hypothetical protein